MSESNGSVATLEIASVDDDAIESIEDVTIAEVEDASGFDQDAILAQVETFDAAFESASPEARKAYREFGQEGKDLVDPSTLADAWYAWSAKGHDIMKMEFNSNKTAYKRSVVTERLQNALLYCDCPGYDVNHILPLYWLIHLVRSTQSSEPGVPRSFTYDEIPADFFDGNLSHTTMRYLQKYIKRTSGDSEIDAWEFRDGWEPRVREYFNSLRAGKLSLNGLKALCEAYEKHLAMAAQTAKAKTLSPEAEDRLEKARETREKQKKFDKLRELGHALNEYAIEAGIEPETVRNTLAESKVIPQPAAQPSLSTMLEAYARTMTPGEGVALIQKMADLARFDEPNSEKARRKVISAIGSAVKVAVQQLNQRPKSEAA